MLRRVLFSSALLLACIHYVRISQAQGLISEDRLRSASESAIKLIQQSQAVWYQKQSCTSCHHQLIPEVTMRLARERGVALDSGLAKRHTSTAFAGLKDLDEAVQGAYFIDVFFDAINLASASEARIKPTLPIVASALFVARRQMPDGSWRMIDNRPPQAHSTFAATAYAARAIRDYLPNEMATERDSRLQRARQWLLNNSPKNNEDRVFRLLGLRWTGAPQSACNEAERVLAAEQRDDGGWSQLPYLTSNAYTTGEALIALSESGTFSVKQPAWQRGIAYLLNTQKPDGSWYVKSRLNPPAPVSPPYFETQFPYGHDQFISIMGSSWAAAALLKALPPKGELPPDHAMTTGEPVKAEAWIKTVLTGSVSDLKKALDEGMNPNSKTPAGTTVLMLAASDPEKLRILLDRGASLNDRSESGFSALMVASRHFGNGKAVKLLLSRGASPAAPSKVTVTNDMSAMFLGTTSGDVEIVEALANAGAPINIKAHILGAFYASPLLYATFAGDEQMVAFLLRKGADPNEADPEGPSTLSSAVIGNHTNVAKRLIQAGAKVNAVDSLGMTPLLYAASIDYGDSEMMDALIAAGADASMKDKQGRTALGLAEVYKHVGLMNVLRISNKSR